MSATLAFRPIRPSDEPLLREIYASTRREEFSWSAAEQEAFLRMQFDAQQTHYRCCFPNADFSLVLLADRPVGRLYLDRSPSEVRIIDIALLPEHRGKGIGTAVLSGVLAEAAQAGKPVLIHVERFNPALRLYQRLGFELAETGPIYLLLRKPAPGPGAPPPGANPA